ARIGVFHTAWETSCNQPGPRGILAPAQGRTPLNDPQCVILGGRRRRLPYHTEVGEESFPYPRLVGPGKMVGEPVLPLEHGRQPRHIQKVSEEPSISCLAY